MLPAPNPHLLLHHQCLPDDLHGVYLLGAFELHHEHLGITALTYHLQDVEVLQRDS